MITESTDGGYTYKPVEIFSSGCASEDLEKLLESIRHNDTPRTGELLAVLETVQRHMLAGRI
jgi:hypothetical protein